MKGSQMQYKDCDNYYMRFVVPFSSPKNWNECISHLMLIPINRHRQKAEKQWWKQ